LLVFLFIFNLVLPLNIPHYSSFLFTGILTWNWFQGALNQSTGAIVDNRELLRRPGFSIAILPIVTVTSHLIHFLMALPILILFIIVDNGLITCALVALPVVIALQFMLTLGLAYLVATFHVTFRDTQYLLNVLLNLLFYLTPVFYEASAIPARYQSLYWLNPMVSLVAAYRAILAHGTLPDHFIALLVLGLCATGLLVYGYVTFIRASYRFVEEL
jgi:lipopolysaccharide transport system permease protein